MNYRKLACLTFFLPVLSAVTSTSAADLRVGIIGLDTSHSIAFTKLLNDATDPDHVPGAKVMVAFKGGSPDVEDSRTRIEKFTEQLQKEFGVKLVDSIEELCRQVDVVLLESVDGRPHLEQARPVIKAGKPMFIDKPLAGTLRDAIEIFHLAQQSKVPVFTSSSYRFYDSMVELKKTDLGEISGAVSYGPCVLEPHHPDLFWYGIHSTEALFTVMGTGCESVVRTTTPQGDAVTGVWSGGRIGTFRGVPSKSTPHKVVVFSNKGVIEEKSSSTYSLVHKDYRPLLQEIVKFFQTGIAPVSSAETLEIYAFMEAADESKRQGGKPVKISDVMRKNGAR